MKSLALLFIAFIFPYSSCYSISTAKATNKLPFKTSKYKVEIRLIDGSKTSAYLINVTADSLFYVNNKKEVGMALLNSCANCIKVHFKDISTVKNKKSFTGIFMGVLVYFTTKLIILSPFGDGDSDGITERERACFTLCAIPVIVSMPFFINSLKVRKAKEKNELRKKSSLYQFEIKKKESFTKFYNSPKYKTFTFYIDNFSRKIEGKCTSIEKDSIHIQLIDKINRGMTVILDKNKIDFIK